MSIIKRIFKIGQSEVNSALDKFENPIKLTEQGIRDLKIDLDNSLKAYAEVKALAIKSRRDANEQKEIAKNYEQKAIMLIKKAETGEIDPSEADRLASEVLVKKEEAIQRASHAENDVINIEKNLAQLDVNIKKLITNIDKYENELKTLKARHKVSQATVKLNKQMAGIDSNGTVSMLEKMKEKVMTQEVLSEAYGEMADSNKSIDEEIDAVLKGNNSVNLQGASALEELKKKLKSE